MMEVPVGFDVDVMRLVEVIENGMSSSTFELLKRSDEAALVLNALARPRFVEDCIRHMMKEFVEEFVGMPDSISVTFYQRNEESIHRHDIAAERITTLGRIREELGQQTPSA
jgi:GTP cyclohydrolase-4